MGIFLLKVMVVRCFSWMIKFKNLPDCDKPRERLYMYGSENLSNEELISIILKTGTKNMSVKEVSLKLLEVIGDINKFRDVGINTLMKIDGIGKVKAIEIKAALEFGRRVYLNNDNVSKISFNNADSIYNYFFDILVDKKQEYFAEDTRARRAVGFRDVSLVSLVQFVVSYARDCRLHLSYTHEDIAAFIAGLGSTRLTILQGMSGTGKTSLPKIFSEAVLGNCEIIEVESSWRDKNELLGYYNEFSKTYTPKKFTQALYKARLNPETVTFIVLDEMNLSRIEYYFSDFLSLMENEEDKREIKLLNVPLYKNEEGMLTSYAGLTDGHTLKVPSNVWFIGTANRDESTFEISDKVYDRAHTMNFNKRAAKPTSYGAPIPQQYLTVDTFAALLEAAKSSVRFQIESYPLIREVEALLAPYNISFGNRIANQIESFVNIYCACFTNSDAVIFDAVEKILLSKVVSKLEVKSVENKSRLAAEFEKRGLRRCSEFILKLNED